MVVWQASYEAFGKATITTATITNNLRFPGQYYDEETGNHYNWNRYYDPNTGRYTQEDLIRFNAGDENLYRYVQNRPVNGYDEEGLLTERGGLYYDDKGNIVGEKGLEAPNPLLDPINYIGGIGSLGAKWLSRPYWRYIGPNSSPTSAWMTRGCGWKPPYGKNFDKAKDALQMPFKPTAVKPVKVPWYKPVRGPRPAIKHPEWGKGGGPEYAKGWRWPE